MLTSEICVDLCRSLRRDETSSADVFFTTLRPKDGVVPAPESAHHCGARWCEGARRPRTPDREKHQCLNQINELIIPANLAMASTIEALEALASNLLALASNIECHDLS